MIVSEFHQHVTLICLNKFIPVENFCTMNLSEILITKMLLHRMCEPSLLIYEYCDYTRISAELLYVILESIEEGGIKIVKWHVLG